MDFYTIADEQTVLGFRFAGVDGTIVASPDEARKAFEQVLQDPRIKIVIVTQEIAQSIREMINEIVIERGKPLVVEIPGPSGPVETGKTLVEQIEEAIGVNV